MSRPQGNRGGGASTILKAGQNYVDCENFMQSCPHTRIPIDFHGFPITNRGVLCSRFFSLFKKSENIFEESHNPFASVREGFKIHQRGVTV